MGSALELTPDQLSDIEDNHQGISDVLMYFNFFSQTSENFPETAFKRYNIIMSLLDKALLSTCAQCICITVYYQWILF